MRKIIGIILAASLAITPTMALADAKFESFIQTLWPRVKAAGFSRALFEQAFAGITEPDAAVIKLANTQPEFKIATGDYLGTAVTPIRVDTGKAMAIANDSLMKSIEKKYGVDRYTVLGIWGMESNFGKNAGSMRVMRSLATLIYNGNKKEYAKEQLLSAFRILKSGARSPDNFVGSWAGAMGHTQFIPSSYVSYAVDWNGDGQRDIWDTKEDALASTANYLSKAGWKIDRPWGWEVKLPDSFDRTLIGRNHWQPVSKWMALGITQMNGKTFNAPQADAFVMIPQTINGPVFLVTRNFMAIMAYNQSHSYALAVGHLGDRIRGGAPFQANWPSAAVDLNPSQRVEMQKRLNAMGIETGGAADGRFGAQTYEAILTYQKKRGLPLDGQPTLKILELLRKGG